MQPDTESPAEAEDMHDDAQSLRAQLESTRSELQQARDTIDQLERRQKINAMLTEADAIDLEVARLLTESAVEVMEQPDVKLAVDDLRRHKPYLFRHRRIAGDAAMAAHVSPAVDSPADHAKQQAADTGDRRDLLRYLRLRRRATN